MAKLKSIFGDYADSENLQLVIDSRNDRFAPLWFPSYFNIAAPQMSLTFTSVVGASRIEAVASVVDRDSKTPLRSRPDLTKYSGEIPVVKEMFAMKESDLREFRMMEALSLDPAAKKNQILDYIWNDTKKVGNAAYKRIDMMTLEAISTGFISLSVATNPDGIVLANPIDLLMPSANKTNAAFTWATAATATPLTDINAVIALGKARGVTYSKILMSDSLWNKFNKAVEVIDTMKGYFYAGKLGNGFNPIALSTLDNVNTFLSANRLPVVEIVDQVFGVESDGVIGVVRPFNDNKASFIPAGNLGTIKNAYAMEELNKVANVSYAKFGSALISKWNENEPLQEWTKAEWNAFPSIDSIDSIHILTAVF
ncbi:major capsid protein [Flavitalea antarctica]